MYVRTIDPDVAHLRGKVAGYARVGDLEAAEGARQELAQARILAAARKVAAQLPELSPERLAEVRALLGGA